MQIKNLKTSIIWQIDENNEKNVDLIRRLKSEIDADGNKVYEVPAAEEIPTAEEDTKKTSKK